MTSTGLPSSQRYKRHERRWKRYEKQQPGHRVQLHVKFIAPLQGSGRRKHDYQFTAIDDCTRLRVLKIYRSLNQKTAIPLVVVGSSPTRPKRVFVWFRLSLENALGVEVANPDSGRHEKPMHLTA